MLDPRICPACGDRDDAPTLVADDHERLACPRCGATRLFRRLPLFCLTGPSGAGKSTVAALAGPLLAHEVVTVEQDVLWEARFAEQPGGIRRFRAQWLRLAAMIGQSGRPVLLCGTVVPAELEPLPERALFSTVHYLALTAEPGVLAARLRARPAWRGWDEARIEEMLGFAAELADGAATMQPPVELFDVTDVAAEDAAAHVVAWVRHRPG